jgi:hypothetical protein
MALAIIAGGPAVAVSSAWGGKMNRRATRSDSLGRPALLDALGHCRNVVTREMATMKAAGPLYHSAATVVAAIDALALMLTGQRDYFALKPYSIGAPKEGARGIRCWRDLRADIVAFRAQAQLFRDERTPPLRAFAIPSPSVTIFGSHFFRWSSAIVAHCKPADGDFCALRFPCLIFSAIAVELSALFCCYVGLGRSRHSAAAAAKAAQFNPSST